MIHLRSVHRKETSDLELGGFPFNLPIIKSLSEVNFHSPVTFFVGENGSGKSTFLESLACAIGSVTVGSESIKTDKTLIAVQQFAQHLRLSWQKRTHKGFFLRAEDFFGYAKQMSHTRQDLEEELDAVDYQYKNRSKLATELAKLPYKNELYEINRRYGDGLDSRSHGESFLALFQARFVPDGLYLLDEPEAPLSPVRQLAFLSLLKTMVAQNSQFIIATHSPIILAYPNADIFSFEDGKIKQAKYEELEHVSLTKSFLENPQAYLRHL